MVDIAGEKVNPQLRFVDKGGPVLNNTGSATIPVADGSFAWGAESSTNTASVLLQWERPEYAYQPPSGVSVTEVVEAEASTSGTLVRPLVEDPRGVQAETQTVPILLDEEPPDDQITYRVRLIFEDASNHGEQVAELTFNPSTGSNNWPAGVSDTTTNVVTLTTDIDFPTQQYDKSANPVVDSSELVADYDGSTYTLFSSSPPDLVFDAGAPAGVITYRLTVTYTSGSITDQRIKETTVSTNGTIPLKVDATLSDS